MSLIIIGKVAVGSLCAGAVGVGGFLLHRFLSPTVEIYGFVETPAKDATTTHPLKCKIDSGNPVAFQVESVKKLTDDSKNHVLLSAFKTSHTSESISNDAKLTSEKLYKITIAASAVSATTTTIKSIEVFKGREHQTSKGTINNLFQIKNGETTTLEKWKTNYFVGQASTSPENLQDISGYKCSRDSLSTAGKECTIKPFVADDDATNQQETAKISDLTFTKDANWSSSKQITQHHYYLIEFKDDSDSKDQDSFTETEIVYLKEEEQEKVTFKKLSAVAFVENQLLILKQQSAA